MHKPLLLGLFILLTLGAATLLAPRPGIELVPETVALPARTFNFRPAGDYWQNGQAVDAPARHELLQPHFEVMKYQVSQGEYARCVAEGDCLALSENSSPRDELPLTGASLLDAQRYASWLSRRTGQRWRLPTDLEWAFFAGSRWKDDALLIASDGNPARRWLARYRVEAGTRSAEAALVQVRGHHGVNELGVADLGGNVWEWTQSCQQRVNLDSKGAVLSHIEACSIRIAEGRHRAAINDFVRDARGGGCTAGQPPDHLGFRLIRDLP